MYFICVLLLTLLLPKKKSEFDTFLQQQQKGYQSYKKKHNQDFSEFVAKWQQAEAVYRETVKKKWPQAELASQKKWVEYSTDLNKKLTVDFDKGEVKVDVLASSNKEALAIAKQQIKQLSTESIFQKYQRDPVVTAMNNISSHRSAVSHMKKNGLAQLPVLSAGVIDETLSQPAKVVQQDDKISIVYALPESTLSDQAQRFLPEIQKSKLSNGIYQRHCY